MTHPPMTLKRWHPLNLVVNRLTGPTTVTFDAGPPTAALLVELHHRMDNKRNRVTLHRAAQVNGLLENLFEPDTTLAGQPWYDHIPRIIAMDTEATINEEKLNFTWTNEASPDDDELDDVMRALNGEDDTDQWSTHEIGENTVAKSITIRLLVRTGRDNHVRRHVRQLHTDFGVGNESGTAPDDAGIMVTPDCGLDVDALKNLMAEAIFEYGYDQDRDDSRDTQWRNFMEQAHTAAAKLLLNEHEAVAEAIRHAARTHLHHLLPDDRTVQLRKSQTPDDDIPDVQVVVLRNDQTYGGW